MPYNIEEFKHRSENIQELLGKTPSKIIRWGITFIAVIILLFLQLSYFIKYPDKLSAKVTLHYQNEPFPIVAKQNAVIDTCFISERELVKKGQYIAILKGDFDYQEVISLKKFVDSLNISFQENFNLNYLPKLTKLGALQQQYQTFISLVNDYNRFKATSYYHHKIVMIKEQILSQEEIYRHLQQKEQLLSQNFELQQAQFSSDSTLYRGKYISKENFSNSSSQFLQNKLTVYNSQTETILAKNTFKELQDKLLEFEHNLELEEIGYKKNILENYQQLSLALTRWESDFVLKTDFDGLLSATKFQHQSQLIEANDTIFFVQKKEMGDMMGKLELPIEFVDKIKDKQEVKIAFKNYPHRQFGKVKGVINSLSLAPTGGRYFATITFPNGLKTTYNQELQAVTAMQGEAEIITKEYSLLSRLIAPIVQLVVDN